MSDVKNKIFYLTCFGFIAGVLWRSFFSVDVYLIVLFGLVFAVSILFFSLILKNNRAVFVSVFALAVLIGILRFHIADKRPSEIFEYRDQKISLSGIIADDPEKRENNVEFIVKTKTGEDRAEILIFAKKDDDYRYGDEINFTGKPEKPQNFLTDNGKEFDYVDYLKKDDIFYVMRYPKIAIISRGRGNLIKRALYNVREIFDAKINSAIPAPENALMGALILGERSSLSQELRQKFINTGTIHIITISGYHIALVAEWIMKIFGFLPINFAALAGILGIFLYVIITGGAQTAVRAGIMAAIALFARITGRISDISRALALTAVVMIFINPFILAFDVSFELSFLATIAVIFLSPKIEKYFNWIKWKWLRDIVSLTSAAYIFVLPFIIYKMGNLSLTAFPSNIAVLPFIPATMIFGFAAGFAGFISDIFAVIPAKIAFIFLRYELSAVNFFSSFSFSSLTVPNFPLILVVFIYVVFIYGIFGKSFGGGRILNGKFFKIINFRFLIFITPVFLTFIVSGFLYYNYYKSKQAANLKMKLLFQTDTASVTKPIPFTADHRTKSNGCEAKNNLPDHDCTPGAIFKDATLEQICVAGYTKTVRKVSTKLRKQVYAEYGTPYPQSREKYEVDHLIPLALGGSNDIANLFLEAAAPEPGFHEKDIVEIYLQQEVCAKRVALPVAQKLIASDWIAVYDNLTLDDISAIKKKYGIR